jgi:translation elongation factor EF-4
MEFSKTYLLGAQASKQSAFIQTAITCHMRDVACCLLQARGMSIKAMPMSLVMENMAGKSYLINLVDCPGE